MRRRVAQQLSNRLAREVAAYLDRRRREALTAPADLRTPPSSRRAQEWDPQLDLSLALDCALRHLDPPTLDALHALADRRPLAEIARRHGLTHAAVRQRLTRARRRLQPELANFHRVVA